MSMRRRVARWMRRSRTMGQGVEGETQEEQGMPRERQLRTYTPDFFWMALGAWLPSPNSLG